MDTVGTGGSEAEVFAGILVDHWIDLDNGSFDPMCDRSLRSNACPTLSATLTNREYRARTYMIYQGTLFSSISPPTLSEPNCFL